MSDASFPANPYRPPSDFVVAAGNPSARPGGLTAIAVIAIVVGILGILSSAGGLVMMAANPYLQQMLQPPSGPGGPSELEKAQQKSQAEIQAVADKYQAATLSLLAVSLISAVCFTFGGFKALGLSRSGRLLLLVACGLAVFYELGHWVEQFVMVPEMSLVMQRSMRETFEAEPDRPGNRQAQQFVDSFLPMVFMSTLVITVGIGLVKMVYYFYTLIYLNREHVRARFLAAPPKA